MTFSHTILGLRVVDENGVLTIGDMTYTDWLESGICPWCYQPMLDVFEQGDEIEVPIRREIGDHKVKTLRTEKIKIVRKARQCHCEGWKKMLEEDHKRTREESAARHQARVEASKGSSKTKQNQFALK